MQSWLLLNAWGRAMLTILLLFIQMHMTKLSLPFQCTMVGGSSVMSDDNTILCHSMASQVPLYTVMYIYLYVCSRVPC